MVTEGLEIWMFLRAESITTPPTVQLSLQSLNGLLHRPVLLLFLLILLLPLLSCELQVHWHGISNGLGSSWRDAAAWNRQSIQRREGEQREWKRWRIDEKKKKREDTTENRTVNKRISALAAQWKSVRISLICMQIGFLPNVLTGAWRERISFLLYSSYRGKNSKLKECFRPPKIYSHKNTAIIQPGGR